jgi:hypothetical protein
MKKPNPILGGSLGLALALFALASSAPEAVCRSGRARRSSASTRDRDLVRSGPYCALYVDFDDIDVEGGVSASCRFGESRHSKSPGRSCRRRRSNGQARSRRT